MAVPDRLILPSEGNTGLQYKVSRAPESLETVSIHGTRLLKKKKYVTHITLYSAIAYNS
jgi:hypothetical protein